MMSCYYCYTEYRDLLYITYITAVIYPNVAAGARLENNLQSEIGTGIEALNLIFQVSFCQRIKIRNNIRPLSSLGFMADDVTGS